MREMILTTILTLILSTIASPCHAGSFRKPTCDDRLGKFAAGEWPEIGEFKTPFVGKEIILWNDPKSIEYLSTLTPSAPFFALTQVFESQVDKFMCGPASISMVLNAIGTTEEADLPINHAQESFARTMNPDLPRTYRATFPKFTQVTVFQTTDPEVKPMRLVYGAPGRGGEVNPGMDLQEMHDMLTAHDVFSKIHYVELANPEDHRLTIAEALQTRGTYVIANFDRAVWGLKGGGHITPLGAYDPVSDKVLILDVNLYGRWLWIDFDLLLKSMASPGNSQPRGYLTIRKANTTDTETAAFH